MPNPNLHRPIASTIAMIAVPALLLGLAASGRVVAFGATPTEAPAPKVASSAKDPVADLAREIDHHIEAGWTEEKVPPAPPADDAEFLRRTYLNLIGRIPSASEVQLFLEDASADKRRRMVDQLLDGPGYAAHFAEILRSAIVPDDKSDFRFAIQETQFIQWLRERVLDNAPYDATVRELLTSSATASGPAYFFAAKQGKPENIAAGASRVFMGLRIECAQCHNHPFAKWKREQFWQFAAFFAGINAEANGQIREQTSLAELKIPDTDKIAKAKYLDDSQPDFGVSPQPRKTIAAWITAEQNPYFAKAAVNRIWAQFLGTGIVDPIDDFDESNPPSHPELLDALARSFREQNYDLKFLIRAICASHVYQLSSAQTDPKQADRRLFARAAVKGLTPLQLVSCLAQSAGYFDTIESNNLGANFVQDGQLPLRQMVSQLFAGDNVDPVETPTTILQALALMNGRFVDSSTSPSQGGTLSALLDAPFLDSAGRIEMLYLATVSRRPTPDESTTMLKYVDSGGAQSAARPKVGNVFQRLIGIDRAKNRTDKDVALGDVFWALLNSSEFLTNH